MVGIVEIGRMLPVGGGEDGGDGDGDRGGESVLVGDGRGRWREL